MTELDGNPMHYQSFVRQFTAGVPSLFAIPYPSDTPYCQHGTTSSSTTILDLVVVFSEEWYTLK